MGTPSRVVVSCAYRNKVKLSFTNITVSGFYLVIDQQSRIQGARRRCPWDGWFARGMTGVCLDASELGWLKMPTLMHYAWASQWYDYYTNMLAQVDSYDVVVPIARDIVRLLPSSQLEFIGNTCAVRSALTALRTFVFIIKVNDVKMYTARVKLPSRNTILQSWTDLTLDLAMSCLGTRDEDCPIWFGSLPARPARHSCRTSSHATDWSLHCRDRLYYMRVCCDGSPDVLCQKELGRCVPHPRMKLSVCMS
jgi:hypothetical protein